MATSIDKVLVEDPREIRLSLWVREQLAALRETIVKLDADTRAMSDYDPKARVQITGGAYPLSLPDGITVEVKTGDENKEKIFIRLSSGATGLNLWAGQGKQIALLPIDHHVVTVQAVSP